MRKRAVAARWRASLLGGALLLLGGCDGAAPAPAGPARRPRYFDIRGLLMDQIQRLTARQAAVSKRVSLRGAAPTTTAVPAVKWADELQIFFQADLNKAALRGAYAVDSVAAGPDGAGATCRYTRRPGYPNAPVRELLVRRPRPGQTDIRADITQQNTLFAARKQLTMTLVEGQLTEYGVRGTQKLVFFDTLHYETAARVMK